MRVTDFVKIKIGIVLLFVTLLSGCRSRQSSPSNVYIDSFSEESNASFFENVYSDVRVVPLSLDGAVLSSPFNLSVDYAEGRFLISDMQTGSIFLCAPDGSLATHISKVGRGPGEYRYVTQCKYFNHRIVVLADGNHMIEYSEEGNLIKETQLEEDALGFFPLGNQEYALFLSRYNGESDQEDRIVITDSSFVKKRSFLSLPYQLYNDGSHISPVVDGKGCFLCVQQTFQQVFKCDKDSVVTTYHYDLKGKGIPESFLKSEDYGYMLDVLMNTPDMYYLVNAFESRDYLFQALRHLVHGETMRIGQWLIDKRSFASRIEYADMEAPLVQFLGPPQMLTSDNEVLYICDLSLFDSVGEKVPGFAILDELIEHKASDCILLCCKIGRD